MTTPQLLDSVTDNITPQGGGDKVTSLEVRTVFNQVIGELKKRGIPQVADTTALAGVSGTDSQLCFVDGNFSLYKWYSSAPVGAVSPVSATGGGVWAKVMYIAAPTLNDVATNGNTSDSELIIQGQRIGYDEATNTLFWGDGSAVGNTGDSVTAVGNDAAANNSGTDTTALGDSAANDNAGQNVTAVGSSAGAQNTGNDLTAVGLSAGEENTANDVTALGRYAGRANTGQGLTAIGVHAGESNEFDDVIAIGKEAQATAAHQLALKLKGFKVVFAGASLTEDIEIDLAALVALMAGGGGGFASFADMLASSNDAGGSDITNVATLTSTQVVSVGEMTIGDNSNAAGLNIRSYADNTKRARIFNNYATEDIDLTLPKQSGGLAVVEEQISIAGDYTIPHGSMVIQIDGSEDAIIDFPPAGDWVGEKITIRIVASGGTITSSTAIEKPSGLASFSVLESESVYVFESFGSRIVCISRQQDW